MSWDTEGGLRSATNLFRAQPGMCLQIHGGGKWLSSADLPAAIEKIGSTGARYRITVSPETELLWTVVPTRDSLSMTLVVAGTGRAGIDSLRLILPFDPRVTPTTVLPSLWADDGSIRLPAVISAPDFGQMLLADVAGRALVGHLEGSRAEKKVDLSVEIPVPKAGEACKLELSPIHLPPPAGLQDIEMWRLARRGWFNAWQPSAQWGEVNRPFSAPAGILANNVISDPASCSLWFYADQALWMPKVTPEISVAALVRRSVDFWLEKRTRPTGEVICYWDYGNFLDANAGPIIAAWDYVESTGDKPWLASWIERLESVAEFLARRDIDHDGLVEATQSGNRGTLQQPARSCAWFDAVNCGHKDAYTNTLIYRAWRCLAEMEGWLDRADKQARYGALADHLKASYFKTLYNPQTGWLAWWKSQDGELHDYAAPTINGIAIEYGLVSPEQGRQILARLWTKIDQVGYKRLDLGVPLTLVPVHRSDYLLPDALGIPQREDGSDTFGHYQNGGVSAGHVLHFLAAHYVVGEPQKADALLRAMLARQAEGKFQCGVRDAGGQGIDFTDWEGRPTGYEGYLADSFRFLQAVLLREKAFRNRYYRPLLAGAASVPQDRFK
jgi:hypothetical protein